MPGKDKYTRYVKFVIYLIIIILLNLAGTTLFFRVDLTDNQMYSISDASKKVVATLATTSRTLARPCHHLAPPKLS